MSKMTLDDILDLDEEQFDEELDDSLRSIPEFRAFLDPIVINRTAEYLRNLRDIVDGQLLRHSPTGIDPSDDPTWVPRTKGFRGVVSSRLHMAQGRIREIDKANGDSNTYVSKEWKRFSHKLAEALDMLDPDVLETIDVPFCDLNAGEWLDIRLEKQPLRTGANA